MTETALEKFKKDFLGLNANTDALIIDVRYNPGGYLTDKLLEVITKKQSAFQSPRTWGSGTSPKPSDLYQKPIVLLINENSGSDAEVFSNAFKDLKLGTIIGMPTGGQVIGTQFNALMDGSHIQLPSVAYFTLNMTTMENNGVQPDIIVPLTPNDVKNHQDTQLQKAIEVLLQK
jgi:C-terminal processing protease CtpA/Prc